MNFPPKLSSRMDICENLRNSGVLIIDPDTTYINWEGARAIGNGTIIYPNTHIIAKDINSFIGKNCRIGPNAFLRDWFIIGDNVKIGFGAEVVRSKIEDHTKAAHFCHIGDAIIGRGCNIAAGVIFCNFDGKKKDTTIVEDNVFIGSGANLIAPVRIGKHAYIGAGAIISRNVKSYDLVVGVNKVVEGKKSYYGYYDKPGWHIYPIDEHPVWNARGGY